MRRITMPSPAMVVACAALVLSLGGTGYAVTTLPKGSVGSAQLRGNAVLSAKVKDGSLRAVDFAPGQLPAGQQGPAGPAGPAGPQGLAGPGGSPGISGYELVAETKQIAASYSSWGLEIHCPPGKKVLGGGFLSAAHATVTGSRPSYVDSAWQISAQRDAGYSGTWTVSGRIVCATVN